ncbi:MAG: polysaccharide biosynthesis/export family protein [Rhodobacteraceae bacterium]|jgi:exopolysaccharide production protein ExoF|nr:polysaccharide biosynthesis/export family protein [Paracoccaceae bacterium]
MSIATRRLGAAALAAALSAGLAAAEVAIAPDDVLNLRVTEWMPIEGSLRDWPAFAGTYQVAPDGTLSLPHIGRIEAAGLAPADLGGRIGAALMEHFALAAAPDAAVSIAERPPVLVGGAVRSPGEVPFHPGMTARHAIALAGGPLAPANEDNSLMLQRLNAEAQLGILASEEASLVLRQARLRAELDGAEALPETAAVSGAAAEALRADEERLLALRRERLARELELIDGRIDLLTQEIASLEAKQEALGRQRTLAEEQKERAASLADRGLVVSDRLVDAERTLVTIETQVLDTSTAMLRARQSRAVAQSERVQLVEGRAADLLVELQTVEVALAATRERIALQSSIAAFLTGGLAEPGRIAGFEVVVRRDGAVAADGLDAPLEPGDLIEVVRPDLPGLAAGPQQGG